MQKLEVQLADESATLTLGQSLSAKISPGFVIYLFGDLGAGKTTLVRGFLQGLGHQGKVKSPTYTLVEPYCIDGLQVYHFDLYRLADPEELEYAGGRDYFNDESVCLVEWPDKGAGWLARADLAIHLHYAGLERRAVLKAESAQAGLLLDKMPA